MSPKAKPRPQPASSTPWHFEKQQTQRFAELGALTATEPIRPRHAETMATGRFDVGEDPIGYYLWD